MDHDLGELLDGWDFEAGRIVARKIEGDDGRPKLQFRLDCGILQMETEGRPDGRRPHGRSSILDYLRIMNTKRTNETGDGIRLTDELWREIDRELLQFYHRRICWLAVREFRRAIADADHNLALMDFVREHSDDENRIAGHEQHRPFVLLHRTQASAHLRLDAGDPEAAIGDIKTGSERIRSFLETAGGIEAVAKDPHLATLREIEKEIRIKYGIRRTLTEELEDAVAAQDYERAVRIRDRLRERSERKPPP